MASTTDVVYAMDVEMVQGCNRQLLAGRIVLVRSDPHDEWVKVLDVYVRYPNGIVRNCMTRYSRIEKWQLNKYGVDLQTVVLVLLDILRNKTLVTFSGNHDFSSLGISNTQVQNVVKKHVELQDYFKRPDGTPYGLGPLIEYFDYSRHCYQDIIIRNNCCDNAVYTLRLYRERYRKDIPFKASCYILSKKEYCAKHGLC